MFSRRLSLTHCLPEIPFSLEAYLIMARKKPRYLRQEEDAAREAAARAEKPRKRILIRHLKTSGEHVGHRRAAFLRRHKIHLR
jgi:hypothetical protein